MIELVKVRGEQVGLRSEALTPEHALDGAKTDCESAMLLSSGLNPAALVNPLDAVVLLGADDAQSRQKWALAGREVAALLRLGHWIDMGTLGLLYTLEGAADAGESLRFKTHPTVLAGLRKHVDRSELLKEWLQAPFRAAPVDADRSVELIRVAVSSGMTPDEFIAAVEQALTALLDGRIVVWPGVAQWEISAPSNRNSTIAFKMRAYHARTLSRALQASDEKFDATPTLTTMPAKAFLKIVANKISRRLSK